MKIIFDSEKQKELFISYVSYNEEEVIPLCPVHIGFESLARDPNCGYDSEICRKCWENSGIEMEVKNERDVEGIVSRSVWEARRVRDLREAIDRYIDAGRVVPSEWFTEFNELRIKEF